jgi:hypothetical protein
VEQRQACWFAAAGLVSTLLLPVLAVYWDNSQNGRYLLPCLILPWWWLLTMRPAARRRGPLTGTIVVAGLLALVVWRAPEIRFAAWSWPYPERIAELDRFLAADGRDRGLADFWHAHYVTTVTHSGLRLTQLQPDGRVKFWGNNAFHHFEAGTAEAPLRAPRYSFIVANDLDPMALREKFGAPARMVQVSGYEIWLYDEAGAEAMSVVVDSEVRAFLGDRPGTERIEADGRSSRAASGSGGGRQSPDGIRPDPDARDHRREVRMGAQRIERGATLQPVGVDERRRAGDQA